MQVPFGQLLSYILSQDRLSEALVSRKGGNREVTFEGSETTKLGTDPATSAGQAKQKPYLPAGRQGRGRYLEGRASKKCLVDIF